MSAHHALPERIQRPRAARTGFRGSAHREYRPGEFAVAWHPKASEKNEHSSLGLTVRGDRVLVRQIAGLIARRIVTYPEQGEHVERGERIGLIRFGSRVDLFIPLH